MVYRIVVCSLWLGTLSIALAAAADSEIEDVMAALRSPEERVRLQAIDQLGRLGPEAAPAVPAVEVLLSDESAVVRARAARALGRMGDSGQRAVPALIDAIGDPEPAVRRTAIEALSRLRPDPQITIRAFIRLMEDSVPSVRLRALNALAEHGESAVPAMIELLDDDRAAYWACLVLNQIGAEAEAAVPALAERVSDPREEVRREAILALANIGEAAVAAVDELAAALDRHTDQTAATYALGRIGTMPPEAESRIRENAHSQNTLLATVSVWTLAQAHPEDKVLQKEATVRLVEALGSEEPRARAAAAEALATLRPDPEMAGPIVEKFFEGADEESVEHALDAVAGLGPAMVPQLTGALRFAGLRPHIAFILGEMGPDAESSVEALTNLLHTGDRLTQHETLIALAKIGPAARGAVPALTAALRKPDGLNLYGVVYALGQIGPAAEPARLELMKTTESEDGTLALLSAWALAGVAPECTECAAKTVPVLVEGLDHPDARYRRESALALAAFGPLARPAVPALERALEDSDISVRTAATAALKAVRPEDSPSEPPAP